MKKDKINREEALKKMGGYILGGAGLFSTMGATAGQLKTLFPNIITKRTSGKSSAQKKVTRSKQRPNILMIMSDNQSSKDVGCYGNSVVKTPNIDKVANKGVSFMNAYCQCPSCSPARAALLTGRNVWTLRQAADLWSNFPSDFTVYPELLEKAGYKVGITGKGWGPGNFKVTGWNYNPGGERFSSFKDFYYNEVTGGQPWCLWMSSTYPSRPFTKKGEWKWFDINPDSIKVPPYLPDSKAVRRDIADYYGDIELFDNQVGHIMSLLDTMGELNNTIVIIVSDNGWQMPRGLANLYDSGTKIPLIISWPGHFKEGRRESSFVLLNDLAPTILRLANVPVPNSMTAKSLVNILRNKKNGAKANGRQFVVLARERHAMCRESGLGYPERAIRTNNFLYIRNYKSDRWPAGDPPLYGDVDANNLQYPCPTKMYMLKNKNKSWMASDFQLVFGKRPKEELYDLKKDPYEINNVAGDSSYQKIKNKLSNKLTSYLQKTGDPREGGKPFNFDDAIYYNEADKTPHPSKKAIKELGLKREYNYFKADDITNK